jgi:putative Ca2+/H+ antiporter (TMEM165/GDT1 family)
VVDAFFLSFGVILLAELGDKSQLITLTYATRYPAVVVLLAVTFASLAVFAVSVSIGLVAAVALPTAAINVAAGLAFFFFAWWTLREDDPGEMQRVREARGGRWAILTIGMAFFLAELGDKTMLASVTLATTEEPIGTWLGSTAGMVLADTLAIAVGSVLGARLPDRAIRAFASAAFVVFGIALIAEGLGIL